MLVRKPEQAEHMNTHRRHPQYLSDMELPAHITASADPKAAFEGVTYIIHAIPVQYSRLYLQEIAPFVPKDVPIISTSKVRRLQGNEGCGWTHPSPPLYLLPHHPIITTHIHTRTSQGIEKGTLAMMNDILLETLGARELAFLSGPSFARCVRISAFLPCRVLTSFGFDSFY